MATIAEAQAPVPSAVEVDAGDVPVEGGAAVGVIVDKVAEGVRDDVVPADVLLADAVPDGAPLGAEHAEANVGTREVTAAATTTASLTGLGRSDGVGWLGRAASALADWSRTSAPSGGADQPVVEGEHHRGRAVAEVELGEDVSHVRLHRALGEH